MYYSAGVGLAVLVLTLALIFLGYALYTQQKNDVLATFIPTGTDEAIGTIIPECIDQPLVPASSSFSFDQPRYDSVRITFDFPQPDQTYEWTLARITDNKTYFTSTNIDSAVFSGVLEGTYTVLCKATNACGATLTTVITTITTCSSTLPPLDQLSALMQVDAVNGDDNIPVKIGFKTLPDPDVVYSIVLFSPISSLPQSISTIYETITKYKPAALNLGLLDIVQVFIPNPCKTSCILPLIARITPMTKCALGASIYLPGFINV